MKKVIITLTMLIIAVTALNINPNPAFAATKKVETKTTVKKVVAKKASVKTTMKWDASALKIVTNPNAFDHSTVIRNAYIKKVESYAKRHKIKVITAKVVNGMRE